jgi:hypothetical protein
VVPAGEASVSAWSPADPFDRQVWESRLHDSIMRSMNAHVDEIDGAFDRLVCEDVDVERMKRYRVPNSDSMENGLLVDDKKAYESHTRIEQREGKYLLITTGKWVGEWAHMQPALPQPDVVDVDDG